MEEKRNRGTWKGMLWWILILKALSQKKSQTLKNFRRISKWQKVLWQLLMNGNWMQIIQLGCEVKYSACRVQNVYWDLWRLRALFYFTFALLSADISNMTPFTSRAACSWLSHLEGPFRYLQKQFPDLWTSPRPSSLGIISEKLKFESFGILLYVVVLSISWPFEGFYSLL